MTKSWITLALAILAETAATLALKQSDGLRRPWWLVIILLGYASAFLGLAQASRRLDIGTAYAVWAGTGTGIVAVLGVVFFHESLNSFKVVGLILIILAVALLHMGSE